MTQSGMIAHMETSLKRTPGSAAWCARLLRSTAADILPLVSAALGSAADLPAGAPRSVMHEFVQEHPHGAFLGAVVLQSKEDMERSLRAVADFVDAIITLFESTTSAVLSSMALTRASGEAVARFCHLHDPNQPPAQTIARMVAVQLLAVEDNLRTAEAFGEHGRDDAEKATGKIREIHKRLTDNGFHRTRAKREVFTANISLGGAVENLSFNATDAFKKYVKVGSWEWALGSGAVHTRAWLLPNLVGTFKEPPFMDRDEVARFVALALLELATAFATSIGGHCGFDPDPYLKKIHQRRVAVSAIDNPEGGQAVGHREYGERQVSPVFPHGTEGASFIGAA